MSEIMVTDIVKGPAKPGQAMLTGKDGAGRESANPGGFAAFYDNALNAEADQEPTGEEALLPDGDTVVEAGAEGAEDELLTGKDDLLLAAANDPQDPADALLAGARVKSPPDHKAAEFASIVEAVRQRTPSEPDAISNTSETAAARPALAGSASGNPPGAALPVINQGQSLAAAPVQSVRVGDPQAKAELVAKDPTHAANSTLLRAESIPAAVPARNPDASAGAAKHEATTGGLTTKVTGPETAMGPAGESARSALGKEVDRRFIAQANTAQVAQTAATAERTGAPLATAGLAQVAAAAGGPRVANGPGSTLDVEADKPATKDMGTQAVEEAAPEVLPQQTTNRTERSARPLGWMPGSGQTATTTTPQTTAAPPDASTTIAQASEAGDAALPFDSAPLAPGTAPATAATTAAITAAGQPQMAQQAARQMAMSIIPLPDGPVEISLSPEELGRVRLTVAVSDGAIAVSVQAERQETADLLRRHIETLAREFRDMGYEQSSFSFGQPGGGQSEGSGPEGSGPAAQANLDGLTDDTAQSDETHLPPGTSGTGLDLRL